MRVKTINISSTSRAWKKAQLKRHKAKTRTMGKKLAFERAKHGD